MNDLVKQHVPMNEQYATAFLREFYSRFRDSDDSGQFSISTKEFDDFVWDNGYSVLGERPSKGEIGWEKFRVESNSIRKQMNTASIYGLHGEPSYRADFEGGMIVIRLIESIFNETHEQIAKKLLSLVVSKNAEYGKLIQYLQDNSHHLPPVLQNRIAAQEGMLRLTMKGVKRGLQDYMEEVSATYNEAIAYDKPPLLDS